MQPLQWAASAHTRTQDHDHLLQMLRNRLLASACMSTQQLPYALFTNRCVHVPNASSVFHAALF